MIDMYRGPAGKLWAIKYYMHHSVMCASLWFWSHDKQSWERASFQTPENVSKYCKLVATNVIFK